jgi:hypothetical protein
MQERGLVTRAVRRLAGLSVFALPVLAVAQAQELRPMYPANVYPTAVALQPRASELPFVETPETARYGFDAPFPDVPRKAFIIEDFGGKADGTTDCTPAFYRALAAAQASAKPAELRFNQVGRYYFRPNPELGSDTFAILNVKGARNLVVRGQGCGTVLVMGDPTLGALRFHGGETVMLRDLSIDYSPLPYTQGTVGEINAEAGHFTLSVSPGYPDPAQIRTRTPELAGGCRLAPGRNGASPWPTIAMLSIQAVEPLRGSSWRLQTEPKALAGYLKAGDAFLYIGRRIAQHGIVAERTKDFYAKDIAIFASPGCGLCLVSVEGAHVDGYTDTLVPGSDRLLSTNADGMFCHGVRGGITVRNCDFLGQGDDCINLHSPAYYGRWATPLSDTQIDLTTTDDLRPGDTLEVMDPTVGRIKGRLDIAAVAPDAEGKVQRLTLKAGLASVGYAPATDRLYPLAISASNFKIVHNHFGQNRSRCLLIQARDGLIEANTFENAEGYGVVMGYGGTAWPEGVIPANVTIRNNLFRNLTNEGLAPAIEAVDGSEFRNFRDLAIVGNRFVNSRKMAILLKGVAGARLVDNRIETAAGRRNTWNHPQWYPVDCSLFLENCSGVKIQNLTVEDPGIREAVVYIGKQCDRGEAGVALTGIAATTAPGIPVVRDER